MSKTDGAEEKFNYTGACRFCGQMKTIQSTHVWPNHVIDEHITRQCDCEEAKKYNRRLEAKENAEKAVEKLFGESSKLKLMYGVTLEEDLKGFMLRVVELISDGKLYSCVINESRVKIRIAEKADGSMTVKWTYTAEEEEEV